MTLNDEQKRMLGGAEGPGVQKCMDLLVKWGNSFGAKEMVRVCSAHISPNYRNEFLEEMSEGATRVRCTTTTHATFDPVFWENIGVEFKKDASLGGGVLVTDPRDVEKRANLLNSLGVWPTYTCAPYSVGVVLKQRDVCCWVGSGGQIISNSIFGAYGGRESVSTCFAAAMTGYTPKMGLLQPEQRVSRLLIKVPSKLGTENWTEADYGALGYFIGAIAGQRNVAIEGLSPELSFDSCRMLLSSQPVSGAVAICKIIGLSPGASTKEEAFGGKSPAEVVEVDRPSLEEAEAKLNSSAERDVDLVVLGCPHLSLSEIAKVAALLKGKHVHPRVMLLVGVAGATKTIVNQAGIVDTIEKSGARVVNACLGPMNPLIYAKNQPKVVSTNSARASHYIQANSANQMKTLYGDMNRCIDAALTGKWR
jgi:predicted aconitase